MELFSVEELADVSASVSEFFQDSLPPDTREGMNFLADKLLELLKTTRSVKDKRILIGEFIKMAVCSGMLIQSRRITIDSIMYRDNTGEYDC
jgi:hypothetical protein